MNSLVFAHYYDWFSTRAVSSRWCHWKWDGAGPFHDPDRFLNPDRRDIASVQYPLIGPYDSSERSVIDYHIRLAKAAQLDAFCVDWYGIKSERREFRDQIVDSNFKKLLDAGKALDFPIAVCYEEKILNHTVVPKDLAKPIAEGKLHAEYIAEHYFKHDAYWKIGGRPVFVIWGNHSLPGQAWSEILSVFKPWDPIVFYSYHRPVLQDLLQSKGMIDAFFGWMNISDMNGQKIDAENFYQDMKKLVEMGNITALCGGVWPGFNDEGVFGWGEGTRVIPDPDDALYDLTWGEAIKNQCDFVSIATWNDWNENSIIEPSRELGFKRLEQTLKYVQRLKGLPEKAFDFGSIPTPCF